jgi:4-amino-4-deoxychorismate lyase
LGPLLVNGVESATISALDRGIAFGDGLFETIAVVRNEVIHWARHKHRLENGCERLRLPVPDSASLIRDIQRVARDHDRSVVKLIVTRGTGGRGYSPPDSVIPTVIVARRPWPANYATRARDGVRVCIASHRLSVNPDLAGLKHLNRLDQVLASSEADARRVDEALMRDFRDRVIEGTRCNLFAVFGDRLLTPRLDDCGVRGVMRSLVMEHAPGIGVELAETHLSIDELYRADEIFLCNAIVGIWPVVAIESDAPARFAIGERTRTLQRCLA